MGDFTRRQSNEPRDYKERFEFRFTVGNNIICQRYFKINNFNPLSYSSIELAETIRECGRIIDKDLREKTDIYLDIATPKVFEDKEEMLRYFESERHCAEMRLGSGIVLRQPENAPNYVWGKNGSPVELAERFDTGEYSNGLTSEDVVTYKFAFYDNGREVCSTIWEGIYPKYVRNSIDLSNKKGKLSDGDDPTRLSFDQYVLFKMVEGRSDVVYKIIKDICSACSNSDNSWYTTVISFANGEKEIKYDNTEAPKEIRKEYKRMEAYFNEQSSR